MKLIIRKLPLRCVLIVLFGVSNVAMALPPVVTVFAQHYGGLVVYNYRLINNSPYRIHSVQIGYDVSKKDTPNNYGYELLSDPSGMMGLDIPPASITSPALWEGVSMGLEETPERSIEWSVINDKSPRLAAGQTLTGMSIKLDKIDRSYVSSHATINFSNFASPALSVPIQSLDTTSPTLSVTMSPSVIHPSQLGQRIPITANITVRDDYDPAPAIKLVDIQAVGGLNVQDIQGIALNSDDRSYTIVPSGILNGLAQMYLFYFEATDASGNDQTFVGSISVR